MKNMVQVLFIENVSDFGHLIIDKLEHDNFKKFEFINFGNLNLFSL